MRIHRALRALLVLACLSFVSCGESASESCPGVLCTNCAGEINAMGIEIVGAASGSPTMDAFVNFVMLTVR